MTNYNVLIAILVFCICDGSRVLASPSLQTFNYSGMTLATRTANSISYNKTVYGLCKNSSDNTTAECNIYANSTQFGETFMESCPIEINIKSNNGSVILNRKTVHQLPDDKVLLAWYETHYLERYHSIITHMHLIDLRSCDVLKNITLEPVFEGIIHKREYYYSVFVFEDGSFEVSYRALNPMSKNFSSPDRYLTYFALYDKNGNLMVPAQSPNIPDNLKPNNNLYIAWLPISLSKGHFLVTAQDMEKWFPEKMVDEYLNIKLSVFDSENKVKITKYLGNRKYYKDLAHGFENIAYCNVSYNQPSLSCYLFDSELNVVYNVSVHTGFGHIDARIFVPAPHEMIVLVSDDFTTKYINQPISLYNRSNMRAYKINSKGEVSKPVVLDGFFDYFRKYFTSEGLIDWPCMTVFDDRVCFHFSATVENGQGDIVDFCIDKRSLDIY